MSEKVKLSSCCLMTSNLLNLLKLLDVAVLPRDLAEAEIGMFDVDTVDEDEGEDVARLKLLPARGPFPV